MFIVTVTNGNRCLLSDTPVIPSYIVLHRSPVPPYDLPSPNSYIADALFLSGS